MKRQCASDLRNIFLRAVSSVQPATIFSSEKCLARSYSPVGEEVLRVGDEAVVATGKKCHLIGFGKAVLGMAVQVERVLADRLSAGIISIPTGTIEKFKSDPDMTFAGDSIKVYEGAQNNLPDDEAMKAAMEITKMSESMSSDHILFVLISGGGSALLPLPIADMTLEQKTNIIRALARKGADIEELNIVRIAMSRTKGGKLAHAAQGAHKIFSLIISDIVNDPLHLIASGPTVAFRDDGRSAQNILEKYGLWTELDRKVKTALLENNKLKATALRNTSTHLIASNKTAANAALKYSRELGYKSCILSTAVVGSLDEVTQKYTELLIQLQNYLGHSINEMEFASSYPFGKESFQSLLTTIGECRPGDAICIILAGEPTALVLGNGMGGRNQELALRMSTILYKNDRLRSVCFLSAGTDGIDGPTDAAGAIGCAEVVEQFLEDHAPGELERYIERNDSYNFYKLNERFHILTGHTGTNVMDIHLFIIPVLVAGKL